MKTNKITHLFACLFAIYSLWRFYWFFEVPIDVYFNWVAPLHAKIWAFIFIPVSLLLLSFYSYYLKIYSQQEVIAFWKKVWSFWQEYLVVLVLFYSIYLVSIYHKEGFYFRNNYEIFWFYLFAPMLSFLVIGITFKRKILNKQNKEKVQIVLFSFFTCLILIEVLLRLIMYEGEFKFYIGKVKHPYFQDTNSWFHLRQPNDTHRLKSKEFDFVRKSNSLGFPDKEWEKIKPKGQIRILALGDSFTEGDGAAYEDSYPSVLQSLLNKEFPLNDIMVMNAGVCGSDPFFQYKILEQKLHEYSPDIVLFTNSPNDMFYDYVIYGGFERFKEDSSTVVKPPHKQWWLPIYYNSFLFRFLITHTFYNSYLLQKEQEDYAFKNRVKHFSELFVAYKKLSDRHNFKVIHIMRPESDDFEFGNYENEELIKEIFKQSENLKNIDLLSLYFNELNIDKKDYLHYCWKENRHYNKDGYELMAKAVFIGIKNDLDSLLKTKNQLYPTKTNY
jgi:hypothetical protein